MTTTRQTTPCILACLGVAEVRLHAGTKHAVYVCRVCRHSFMESEITKKSTKKKESNADYVAVMRALIREKKLPKSMLAELPTLRNLVWLRDCERCRYCDKPGDHMDHVWPRSRGGPRTPTNLVCACTSCGSVKGARSPSEAKMKLRELHATHARAPETLWLREPSLQAREPTLEERAEFERTAVRERLRQHVYEAPKLGETAEDLRQWMREHDVRLKAT